MNMKNLLKRRKLLLVDMRSPEKYRDSKIEKFENLPLRNLVNKLIATPDKNTNLVIVSDEQNDLVMAKKYATQYGFQNIHCFDYYKARKEMEG